MKTAKKREREREKEKEKEIKMREKKRKEKEATCIRFFFQIRSTWKGVKKAEEGVEAESGCYPSAGDGAKHLDQRHVSESTVDNGPASKSRRDIAVVAVIGHQAALVWTMRSITIVPSVSCVSTRVCM